MQGNAVYHILGLFSEAGELLEYLRSDGREDWRALIAMQAHASFAGDYKRDMRDEHKEINIKINDKIPDIRKRIASELGDVLWYVSRIAADYNLTLEEVMEMNEKKLRDRQARNVIQGKGDDR